MKVKFLSLSLLLGCLNYQVDGAIVTNQTTSPNAVSNIVGSIFTNGLASNNRIIYIGSTNSGYPGFLIIQSGKTNGIVDEFSFNASNGTNQYSTATILSFVRDAGNKLASLIFEIPYGPYYIPLMELTTNVSVRISKEAIGVYAATSDVNFTLPDDTPLLYGRPNHIVFTNLTATRYVFFPNATNETGVKYHIKNNSAANSPVITNTFGQKFDGAASYTLTNQYSSITLYSDGVNWLVESKIP